MISNIVTTPDQFLQKDSLLTMQWASLIQQIDPTAQMSIQVPSQVRAQIMGKKRGDL